MLLRSIRIAFVLSLLAASGCELVADFDRAKIPTGGSGGSPPDSSVETPEEDAGTDEEDAGQ